MSISSTEFHILQSPSQVEPPAGVVLFSKPQARDSPIFPQSFHQPWMIFPPSPFSSSSALAQLIVPPPDLLQTPWIPGCISLPSHLSSHP